ncbi:DNA gyrase subunit A [Anaerosalibacter bizertensis]|uniref:DNA gyrase subunit A n=1 Tax=Anaerosalibacter bizertensis TaxID=932217 RepID=A0A9Q4AD47_9FIRM|nr:DNA gyrase subunit A [Anaerosalibacter bizertensis]MBV1817258.1 DNA gyrase subunit A [Bacteroidales bacterium MSK.15.36]MCB5560137.1 DNA gyrase subunit A [Anaerosalibacter bizertensis]MCG4565353.1 DNA gyrase subunit A [Anaerosalibacter bizertensis]
MDKEENNIISVNIEDEMKKSYLDYAMSVIVSRALPDVRDGLKPVHRRILYAMNELGISPEKQYKKSARVVGDVLGKYHPHSDTSVYDAMVRLAQDFNTRYLLVDGHGNFGSVDGDGAAAMRYTEVRMTKLATEMLRDINKDTIDYGLNFDESLKEPKVLPSRFPNLLVNGSSGIAVGMATSIPPHNLCEVIDGIIAIIDDPEIDIESLTDIIRGPDFPTSGIIMGMEEIKKAYRTGRGKVTVRAKTEIEEFGKNRNRIVVTEIPYQVNKARLIEKIADLVKDKKIEGISDLRDESDKEGMRIVIELKRDSIPKVVLNNLFKQTQMQNTFSIIMLALVDDEPKILNLKEMLNHYLNFQKEVIVRRTKYELKKAEDRAHILEGLKIALDHIDEVINTIRSSKDDKTAKDKLMSKFGLSERQSQAILDMRLRRLTGLERGKIEEEYEELIKEINRLKEILGSEELIYGIIKEELLEIKEKYGDERRTMIVPSEEEINIEDMIKKEDVIITLTHFGYIKRIPENTYRLQRRGGRGVAALTTREEDFVEHLFITSTHDTIMFFTNAGRVHSLKAYEIPEGGRQSKGMAIVNLLNLAGDEKINAVIPISEYEPDSNLVFVTKNGITKRTKFEHFKNIRKTGLIAIGLRDDDELISVRKTYGEEELIIVTAKGMAIRFKEEDVRQMGRTAMGVKGINLNKKDEVVGMDLVEEGKDLLVISKNGYGKRTPLDEYRPQTRGGKGLKTYHVKEKTGPLVSAKVVDKDDEIMMISNCGTIIRLNVKEISEMGRNTQGVTLMKVNEKDEVVAVAKYVEEE